jgi:hypothetical protein
MLTSEEAYRLSELTKDRYKVLGHYELCYAELCEAVIFCEGRERDEAWYEIQALANLITELHKMSNEEYIQKYRWGV